MPRTAENRSKQGKRNRTAGHDFERLIANKMKAIYPKAKRGLQSRDGSECCDVEFTPFFVECKKGRKTNIKGALRQAKEAGDEVRPIMVVTRDDNEDILVTMVWSDFFKLLFDHAWMERNRETPEAKGGEE